MFRLVVDVPDPYVTLKIERSAEGSVKTKTIDDNQFPVWNDVFNFHVDPQEENILGE